MEPLQLKQPAIAAISNVFEWYDFIVFSSLTPILTQVFSPSNKLTTLLLTYGIFAISFIMRPAGGLIFGYLADRYGRKKTLFFTLSLVAISGLLIGLMPTYHQIGAAAPLLLLALRLVQSFAVGGEYPIVVTYLSELAPAGKRGILSSFANVTTVSGVLLASIVVAILNHHLTADALVDWGWRVPFLLSAVFTFFIIIARSLLTETMIPVSSKTDYGRLFDKTSIKMMMKIFLVTMCAAVSYYSYNIFIIIYLLEIAHFNYTESLFISIISSMFLLLLMPIGGYLSDIFGRKKVIGLSLFLLAILSIPLYQLLLSRSISHALISQFIFAIPLSLFFGALPAFLFEESREKGRCLNIAIPYNIGMVIFGGTAPLINVSLVHYLNNNLAPGIYLSLIATISLIAMYSIGDINKKMISGINEVRC